MKVTTRLLLHLPVLHEALAREPKTLFKDITRDFEANITHDCNITQKNLVKMLFKFCRSVATENCLILTMTGLFCCKLQTSPRLDYSSQ